ncbi:vWA domain-containing protein [Streptomyces zhihengii]
MLATAAVLASPAAYAGPGRAPAEVKPAFTSVNYAVAVDESASLSDADMAAEKAAAKRIALGDVSASSRVTVFGFAAAEAEGQSAVDPVCPRTTLDAAGRRTIGDCVGKLRKRTEKEGTGTDFPSAIRQGVHELTTGTDPSVPRVLFLLTDGVMDVSGSAKYGDESHRKEEGERQLTAALESAAANDVQIWPLGFGSAPDKAQLDRIAAGGYQKGCVDLPSARPTADVVTSGAKDLGPKLEKVFAAAHCLRYQPGPEGGAPGHAGDRHLAPRDRRQHRGRQGRRRGGHHLRRPLRQAGPDHGEGPGLGVRTGRRRGHRGGPADHRPAARRLEGEGRGARGAPFAARRRQRAVAGRTARRDHHGPAVAAGGPEGHGHHAPPDP